MSLKEQLQDYIKDLKWDFDNCIKEQKRLEECFKIYEGELLRQANIKEQLAKNKGEKETLKAIIEVLEDIVEQ